MADKVIQVPGVGNVAFPDTMSDDDISSAIGQMPQFKSSTASSIQNAASQPGFLQRLGQSLGLPTSINDAESAAKQAITHPYQFAPAVMIPKMLMNYGQTVAQGYKQGYQQANEADQQLNSGQITTGQAIGKTASGALNATVNAIPFIGPSMVTAGQDIAAKNYAGGAGGLTGIIAQLALAKGGGDAATPKTTTVPDAARVITDAVNPPPKSMTSFEASVQQHLPKALQAAQESGMPITSRSDLAQAFTAAAEKQKAAFENMLSPVKDQAIDTSGIRGYQGPTTYYNTATLGQLYARLRTINATLSPAYEKGGATAKAAISAESNTALNAEASAIRSRLYQEIGQRAGVDPQDVAQLNGSMGSMYGIADKIRTALNKERFTANQAAAGQNLPHSGVEALLRALNKAKLTVFNPDNTVANTINQIH